MQVAERSLVGVPLPSPRRRSCPGDEMQYQFSLIATQSPNHTGHGMYRMGLGRAFREIAAGTTTAGEIAECTKPVKGELDESGEGLLGMRGRALSITSLAYRCDLPAISAHAQPVSNSSCVRHATMIVSQKPGTTARHEMPNQY